MSRNEWIEMTMKVTMKWNEIEWNEWMKEGMYESHFADLIFQECSGTISFLTCSSGSWPLARVLCTFCRQLSPIERQHRPSFGDHSSHFTRRKTGFRARECFQAWVLLHFPATVRDADVVAMMMWLTWWLRWCHVFAMIVRKPATTIVRNSEVPQLSFL